MTSTRSAPHLLTLILLTAVSTLTLNMFLPSLANIADDLDAEYATVSIALAGYLAITAVIQLIVGPLSDRLGRRPVMLGAIVLFAFASVMCALSENIWTFLAFRMLQGGMIAGYVLSLAIVRDTNSERQAAGLIGYISMAMAVAPMLGPMLGGVLDTTFGWRSNFYLYTLLGLAMFVLCWIDLGETKPADGPSQSNLSQGIGLLLRERPFWSYSFCSAFSTGAFYIFLTGAPLVAQKQFGVTTAELGFFIGTITAGFMTGGFVATRLAPVFAPFTIMMAGRIIACSGLVIGLTLVLFDQLSPLMFFGSTIFVGLGNGITMPSSNAAAMSVRPDLAGSAAGINGALVVALGAVLTTTTGIILPAEEPAGVLLMLMLAASVGGLISILTTGERDQV